MRALPAILALGCPIAAFGELSIDNVAPGELVRYPVITLRGACSRDEFTYGLENAKPVKGETHNGRYVALVELKTGLNMVKVAAGPESVRIRIDYRPMKSKYRVCAVWYTSADEGIDYPYEKPGVKQRLEEKLDTALKMLQSFTAEAMAEAGYGRKTFALETDRAGKVLVHIVPSTRPAAELRAANNDRTWSEAYADIKRTIPEETNKYATVMAFSRWDPVARKAQGAFALGGGALGMIYGGTVSLWPNSITEVQSAFADATFVDPAKSYEDSAGRKTVWANVSTAYGAWLHEIGHTFGLPHAADRFAIMSRGFDHFNRRFMLFEPPVHDRDKGIDFTEMEVSHWDPFEAAQLNWSPWFQPDATPFDRSNAPTIKIEGDVITIHAEHGIRVAGAELDDRPPFFQEFLKPAPPTSLTFSLKELREKIHSEKGVRITVIDSEGNRTALDAK